MLGKLDIAAVDIVTTPANLIYIRRRHITRKCFLAFLLHQDRRSTLSSVVFARKERRSTNRHLMDIWMQTVEEIVARITSLTQLSEDCHNHDLWNGCRWKKWRLFGFPRRCCQQFLKISCKTVG